MQNSNERVLQDYENACDAIDTLFSEILESNKQSSLVPIFGITKSYMSMIYSGERNLDHNKKYEFIKKFTNSKQCD